MLLARENCSFNVIFTAKTVPEYRFCHRVRKKRESGAFALFSRNLMSLVSLVFVVAQVNGIVNLLTGGVEAGDEHHLVTVAAAHDLVVDVLNIVT